MIAYGVLTMFGSPHLPLDYRRGVVPFSRADDGWISGSHFFSRIKEQSIVRGSVHLGQAVLTNIYGYSQSHL